MSTSKLDLQPTLVGEHILVRPLFEDDYDSLYKVASDPLIWEKTTSPLRYQRSIFDDQFFNTGISSKSTLVVIDKDNSKIIGSSRFYDIDQEKCELAIGYTFIARSHWGKFANKELKSLMLNHAFSFANRVWFHVGSNNFRSRKALEKIGAILSHNEPRSPNGILIDYCYYYINR